MRSHRRAGYALAASLMVHVAAVATTPLVAAATPAGSTLAPATPGEPRSGGGDTFDIEGLVGAPAGHADVGAAKEQPAATPGAEPSSPRDPGSVNARPDREPVATTPSRAPDAPRRDRHRPRRRAPTAATDSSSPSPASTAIPPANGAGPSEPPAGGAESASDGEPTDGGNGVGPGRYGAAGAPRGVENLARAFTRALPAAVSADPVWAALPVGKAGAVEATISVGGDGRVVAVAVSDQATEPLRHLVERTMGLLRGGELSLTGYGRVAAGRETLRIEVVLSDVDPTASPADLILGSSAPAGQTPGRAYFVLRSGRRFDATVDVLRTALGLEDAGVGVSGDAGASSPGR